MCPETHFVNVGPHQMNFGEIVQTGKAVGMGIIINRNKKSEYVPVFQVHIQEECREAVLELPKQACRRGLEGNLSKPTLKL